jgi:hypothetical protein
MAQPKPKPRQDNKPKPAEPHPELKPVPPPPRPKPPNLDDKPKPQPVKPLSGPDNKPQPPSGPAPVPVFVSSPAPGITTATPVAVIASAYDADQIKNQKIVVGLCESNHVPLLGTIAALCAGSGENTWHTDGCNSSNHCGFWQLDSTWQAMHDYHDVTYWTRYAIQHGFYGQGGLSHIAKAHPTWTPGQVAEACQGAGAAAIPYYDSKRAEAEAVYNRYKSGAQIPGVSLVPTPTLYANPLKDANVTPERIDMGVDYAGTGHYSAIAKGVITTWAPGGWGKYGNYLQYEITEPGTLHGVTIYYAEGIDSNRNVGDTFKAGEWLCNLIPGWHSGTELGFAGSKGGTDTWANEFGGGWTPAQDAANDTTRAGLAFSRLVQQLGGPGGRPPGALIGKFPPWMSNGQAPADLSAAAGVGQSGGTVHPVSFGNPSVGAKSYSWPATQLEAWTALDKRAVDAAKRSLAARDFAAGVTFVKATEG